MTVPNDVYRQCKSSVERNHNEDWIMLLMKNYNGSRLEKKRYTLEIKFTERPMDECRWVALCAHHFVSTNQPQTSQLLCAVLFGNNSSAQCYRNISIGF